MSAGAITAASGCTARPAMPNTMLVHVLPLLLLLALRTSGQRLHDSLLRVHNGHSRSEIASSARALHHAQHSSAGSWPTVVDRTARLTPAKADSSNLPASSAPAEFQVDAFHAMRTASGCGQDVERCKQVLASAAVDWSFECPAWLEQYASFHRQAVETFNASTR